MPHQPIAIVSGGSRGLGRDITRDLLDHDYKVATFSRCSGDFIQSMQQHYDGTDRFYWNSVDVTQLSAVKAFVKHVYKTYGRIDALINNAGGTLDRLLPLTSAEQVRRVIHLNLEAGIMLAQLVSRIMLKQNLGVILNISSILGSRGFKGVSVYSGTKAALSGFSRSLARELGSRGIRVNTVSPGFMDTDMTREMPEQQRAQIIRRTPLGRLGKTKDIVGLVRFLLGPEAGFITGTDFVVDGGLTC